MRRLPNEPGSSLRRWVLVTLIAGLTGGFAAACEEGPPGAGSAGSGIGIVDSDADAIPDNIEGSADTDADWVPDSLDRDSDGDGIEDIIEAGDILYDTPPVDSDGDGTPDFLDDDSDGNGIPDRDEGLIDFYDDGVLDFRDLDDDNDGVSDAEEISGATDCNEDGETDPAGTPENPPDCDEDGLANYLDPDGDGDRIYDTHEGGTIDTDGDGTADRFDSDSDNDGISDRDEHRAGPGARPTDTDGDGTPDFRDPDSDADGLSDADERADGTDPYEPDSDGDGSSDLVEKAAGTNPVFAGDNPRSNGDFIFVVPFQEDPNPTQDTLSFRTNVQEADVYFLFDRTGSMLSEVNAMRSAIGSIIENLTCAPTVVSCGDTSQCGSDEVCSRDGLCIADPAVTGCIPSFHTGAGVYGGDPSAGNPFDNLQSIGPDGSATAAALPMSVGGYGTDEAMFAAVQCMVDPTSCPSAYTANCAIDGTGCPGFRADSQRIFLLISDEDNEWVEPSFTPVAAASALTEFGVNFVGIDAANGGTGNGFSDLTSVATAAGSLEGMGQPLVRSGDGADVVTAVTEAITELVTAVPTRVTIEASEVDVGALAFLDFLEVNVSGADLDGDSVIDCEVFAASETEDTDSDSRDDAFSAVRPGRRLCWNVHPRRNETLEPTDEPVLLKATLTVRGNGAVLDSRDVFFLIPPKPPAITLIRRPREVRLRWVRERLATGL